MRFDNRRIVSPDDGESHRLFMRQTVLICRCHRIGEAQCFAFSKEVEINFG